VTKTSGCNYCLHPLVGCNLRPCHIFSRASGDYAAACRVSRPGLVLLQSEGTANVFGRRGACMMVSGDKIAWDEHVDVLRAAAPAAFYGGVNPEWANTVCTALCTVFSSVAMVCSHPSGGHLQCTRAALQVACSQFVVLPLSPPILMQHACLVHLQGLQQAHAITERFSLPRHVLPGILSTHNYVTYVKGMLSKPSQPLPSLPRRRSSIGPSMSVASGTASAASSQGSLHPAQPLYGSLEWHGQLQRIRAVCQQSGVEHSLIDGMIAAAGAAPLAMPPPSVSGTVDRTPASDLLRNMEGLSVKRDGSAMGEQVAEAGAADALLRVPGSFASLDLVDTAGMMFTRADDDMLMRDASLGDDCLAAAWAP
jgi:hypothetical protein